MQATAAFAPPARPNLDDGLSNVGLYGFLAVMLAGLGFVGYSIYVDAAAAGVQGVGHPG